MHLLMLSLSHVAIDLVLNMVPPLLPVLVRELGLSVALAGLLASLPNLVNGLGMPLFGHLADRRGKGWMLPVTLVAAGLAMASFAFADSFIVLVAFTVAAGFAGSFFHPVAALMIRSVSGAKVAPAMSMFSLGGTVGMALSPVLTAAAVSWLGRGGAAGITGVSLLVAAATVLTGTYRLRVSGLPTSPGNQVEEASEPLGRGAPVGMVAPRAARGFILFTVATLFRTQVTVAVATFLPLYYVFLGYSDQVGGNMLSLFYVAGSAGSVLGAYLADRVGRRSLMMGSLLLATPSLLGFLFLPGWNTLFLILSGMSLFATFSAGIVYGQELFPTNPGLAAGIIMGLVWGLCSLGLSPIGLAADRWGIQAVLGWLSWLPFLALPFMLPVPETRAPRREASPTPAAGTGR